MMLKRLSYPLLVSATLLMSAGGHAQDASYTVPGLEEPAEIIVDRWGVPHLYANTHYDAFFVQGFNAAHDRLWQIDLWRRRGLGQLTEVFGPAYLEQDRASRLFLYRGGSSYTTNNTGFRPSDFLVRSGASFRMVLDVGNWDAARMTNAPGQSGDPRSPFYGNLLEGWATEQAFPLLYSRPAVLQNAVLTIALEPE